MEAVDAVFNDIAGNTGFAVDQLKYLTCMLLTIPFGLLFRTLPRNAVTLKKVFGAAVGVAFSLFAIGRWSPIHSLLSGGISWCILKFLPASQSHKIVFAFLMLYMSLSHIYRIYTDYLGWSLDFTGPQMLLTQSVTSLAFNYHDGQQKELENDFLKSKAIKRLPSLFDFFCFVFYFPAYLAGPSHHYKDYIAVCDSSLFDDDYAKGKCPPNGLDILWALGRALLCVPAFFLVAKYSSGYMLEAAYANSSIFYKIGYGVIAMKCIRMRYYFGWYMAEVGFVAIGEGYNGVDKAGKPRWDRVRNCNPFKVEFPENVRSITANWNICTANWLRYYVYMRLPKGAIQTYGTYFISAFWHGFYPGYYVFFIFSALLTETARLARRKLRPLFLGSAAKPLYDIAGTVCTMTIVDFAGTGFVLLALDQTLVAFANNYYWGVIVTVIGFIILSILPTPKRSEKRT